MEDKIKERFMKKVKFAPSGCWEWQASKNLKGYGTFRSDISQLAHRVSFALFKGELRKDLLVMHSCDNPCCVNPSHLSLGTGHDNQRDCVNKGRMLRKGDNSHRRKLTNNDVALIRSRQYTTKELVVMLNVSKGCINQAKRGFTWKI